MKPTCPITDESESASTDPRVWKEHFASPADASNAPDGVTASKVQKAAKTALKSKPTTVAVGDTHKLPYSDELGL